MRHQLVEETTATVLGAHLAGGVWTARGHDGGQLARRAVESFSFQ